MFAMFTKNTNHHEYKHEVALKFLRLLMLILAAFSVFAPKAQGAGATFSITPASGEFGVNRTVAATIYLHSGGNLINAAEATLNFPSEFLRAVSISKSNSIFSFWAVEPSFDNNQGIISFGGGTPASFSGSSGVVLTITFSVKKAGEGALNFGSGRILLADGMGTDVFSGSQGAGWKFIAAKPAIGAFPPAAPEVSSPTHPDSKQWYSKSSAVFTWPVGKDITGVKLLASKIPEGVPVVFYSPPISEKTIEDFDDGVWYFHVRLRNAWGWGDIAHFRFQIDTAPPNPFQIEFPEGKETTNPRPAVKFETTDGLSGISHYEIKINDGDFLIIPTGLDYYQLPAQSPGKKILIVRAFDKAGNFTDAISEFIILSPPEPPFITFRRVASALAALFILLGLWWVWRRFSSPKKKLRKEIHEAEKNIHKSFDFLKKDIEGQLKRLEKVKSRRELTKEEKEIVQRLKHDLDDVEKSIEKEIEDIEREIK